MSISDMRQTREWQRAHPEAVERAFNGARCGRLGSDDRRVDRRRAAIGCATPSRHVGSTAGTAHARAAVRRQATTASRRWGTWKAWRNAFASSELRVYEGGHLFLLQDRTAYPEIVEWLNGLIDSTELLPADAGLTRLCGSAYAEVSNATAPVERPGDKFSPSSPSPCRRGSLFRRSRRYVRVDGERLDVRSSDQPAPAIENGDVADEHDATTPPRARTRPPRRSTTTTRPTPSAGLRVVRVRPRAIRDDATHRTPRTSSRTVRPTTARQ